MLSSLLSIVILGLAAAAPVTAQEQRVVLIMGDSLTSAYGMLPEQGWAALLQKRLDEQKRNWRVVNAGITGDTTRGGLARLPHAIKQHDPAIVVIELGGNDGLRGINPKQVRTNLTKMIALAQEHNARVLLLGVRIPENYGAAFRDRFMAVWPEVATQTDAALVQFFLAGIAENPDLMQGDGIHPSVEAQALMLDNVWPALEPLLAD